MTNPKVTGKYNVRLKDKKEGKTIYSERWYFVPCPEKKDKGGWSIDTGRYILTDYDPEPIEGTTKKDWKPLMECRDECVSDLAAAIIRLAIEDATMNTIEKEPLTKQVTKSSGNITIDSSLRHRKDAARRYLHNRGYEWLYPDTDINKMRFQYKDELVKKDKARTDKFFEILNNKQIEGYLKDRNLDSYTKIHLNYNRKANSSKKLGYMDKVRKAISKTAYVCSKEGI